MYFTFNQNNSGGSFDFDEKKGISRIVVIEAASPNEANEKALKIGLYFDGCSGGIDCKCCGDRWYSQWDDEKGDEVPSYYRKPIDLEGKWPTEGNFYKFMKDKPEGFVHYADGRIVPFYEQ